MLPADITLASADGLQLKLPIYENEVSAIGYHPINGEDIVELEPAGTQANGSIFEKGLGQYLNGGDGPSYIVMYGSDDVGSAMASIDVGAPAGTMVYSPVDGTIAGIRSYEIRGHCADTEIRIESQGQTSMVAVLTHIENPEVALGQPVKSGVTRLGSVRQLDGCYEQQLGKYTYNTGNHVHMQVERYRLNSTP